MKAKNKIWLGVMLILIGLFGSQTVGATELVSNDEQMVSENQVIADQDGNVLTENETALVEDENVMNSEAQNEVTIFYRYVNSEGYTDWYKETKKVPDGTTWSDFLKSYKKCYESGVITDSNVNNVWHIADYDPINPRNDMFTVAEWEKEIIKADDRLFFNGFPADYGQIFIEAQIKENDIALDGFVTYIYIPKRYEFGSKEACEFVKNSVGATTFLSDRCVVLGGTIDVKARPKSDNSYFDEYYIVTTTVNAPKTWEGKEGVEGFAYRLYNVALFRDAEEAGLKDWTTKLQTKEKTAAEVAQGIIFSQEFMNHNYSNEDFVEILYRTMFGRSGDEAGTSYWLDCLENGVSREYVYHGFAESNEFSKLCESYGVERGSVTLGQYRDRNMYATGFIARLYTKMLGREFDDVGIEYWAKQYLTGQKSIEKIAAEGFLHSAELENQNLSNEEFVTRMYETFLNREPDESGKKDWIEKLENGKETRDSLVFGFTNSPEFGKLKASYYLP